MEKIRKITSSVKYIYIIVYMVCFTLFNNIYINLYLYNETQLLYQGLILLGLGILLFDFFTFGVMLKTKYSILLVLFYIVAFLSVFVNYKYDPISNVKVIAWMLVQTFVFSALDRACDKEHHKRFYRILSETVCFSWFFLCVWSIVLFFSGFQDYIVDSETTLGYVRVGFVEGRLFGIFTDPNFAAACVLFSMLMLVCNMFMNKDNLAGRIYHIVVLAVDTAYIILSRSRTAELCIYVIMAVIGFFVAKHLLEKRGFPVLEKGIVMVMSAVLFASASFVACDVLNTAADYTYIAIHTNENTTDLDLQRFEEETKRDDIGEGHDVTNNRSKIWLEYLEVFKQNPLLGTGPRNGLSYATENMPDSYIVAQKYQYHNGYLAVLVGTGIIGFIFVIIYILFVSKKVLVYLWKESNRPTSEYLPVLMLGAILVVGAISAMSLHILFFNNSACDAMFWFVLGYVMLLVCENEPERENKLIKWSDFLRMKAFKKK